MPMLLALCRYLNPAFRSRQTSITQRNGRTHAGLLHCRSVISKQVDRHVGKFQGQRAVQGPGAFGRNEKKNLVSLDPPLSLAKFSAMMLVIKTKLSCRLLSTDDESRRRQGINDEEMTDNTPL